MRLLRQCDRQDGSEEDGSTQRGAGDHAWGEAHKAIGVSEPAAEVTGQRHWELDD